MAVDPLVEVGLKAINIWSLNPCFRQGWPKSTEIVGGTSQPCRKEGRKESVEGEFATTWAKLGKVDRPEAEQNNQAQVIASYEAANKALRHN